jgi:hypothetical protein
MFVDPNQLNPYDKILGGPKMNDDFNGIKATWTLLRSMIRKQKIERIYGTKNTDRKEKF